MTNESNTFLRFTKESSGKIVFSISIEGKPEDNLDRMKELYKQCDQFARDNEDIRNTKPAPKAIKVKTTPDRFAGAKTLDDLRPNRR